MAITSFSGEHRFLSNFWLVSIEFEGINYPSVEHAYQAAKTDDRQVRSQCLAYTAGQAKRWGRTLTIRDDWEDIKVPLMESLVRQKFTNNLILMKLLIDTGNQTLIEGNTWGDTFWGVCNGEGLNMLGVCLMTVRNELLFAAQTPKPKIPIGQFKD